MYFKNVSIMGLGYVDAPHRVTSSELEDQLAAPLKRFNMRPRLIQELSGVKARHFWSPGTQPSEVATVAAQRAIENSGVDPEKLGVLINTSISQDYIEPSVACLIHGNLNLGPQCMNFDVSNACLGFVNGMHIAGYMIDRGDIDYAIIVNGEVSRFAYEQTINALLDPEIDEKSFRDNFATLTLGSGAAAMVLARSELVSDGHKILGGVTRSATQYNRLCLGQPHKMITDTRNLLIAGLELALKTYPEFLKAVGWVSGEIAQMVVHQVSEPHINRFIETLKLDASKVYRSYPEFGNIGPVNIPLVLAKAVEEGRVHAGDKVALMGIGSGLNCSMLAVEW